MQRLLVFAALLVLSHAKPNGVYQRQYQYQSSSSHYKNNELQQKAEDEAFYTQQGDLEGRQQPKTDGYSSRLRYTNPKLGGQNQQENTEDLTQQTEDVFDLSGLKTGQHGSSSGSSISSNTNTGRGYGSNSYGSSSYGNRHHGQSVNGAADTGAHSSQSSYSYSGSYSSGSGNRNVNSGQSYNSNSELQALAQKLQSDLSQQLQNAVNNQHSAQSSYSSSSSYSTNSNANTNTNADAELQQLQDELKRNLTQQLQGELQRKYGTQGTRDSYSYTISSTGQYQPQANYNNQQIDDLVRTLETNLQKQLREQVSSNQGANAGSTSNTGRVYTIRTYGVSSNLNDLTKQLETDLSKQLRDAVRNQHQLSSYSHTYSSNDAQMSADVAKLKEELRRNLTQQLQDQLQRTYGTQGSRGSYSYTITGGSGGSKPTANYDNQELVDLKQQLENNLFDQLESAAKTEYSQSSSSFSSSSSSSFDSQNGNRNTGSYVPYVPDSSRYRPTTEEIETNSQPSPSRYPGSQTFSSSYNRRRPVTSTFITSTVANRDVENVDDSQKPVEIETFSDNQQAELQPDFGNTPNYRPATGSSHTTTTTNQQTYSTRIYRPVVEADVQLPNVVKAVENDLKYDINNAFIQEQIRSYKQKYNLESDDEIDFDVVLREVKNNFRKTLDRKLKDQLQSTYGTQVEYGLYSYTKPVYNSQAPITANYKLDDLEDLQRRLEERLVQQLTEKVRNEETKYNERHSTFTSYQTTHGGSTHGGSTHGESTYGGNTNGGSTYGGNKQLNKYGSFATNNHQTGAQTSGNQGSRQYSYSYTTNAQSGELDSQLQAIRNDLERQLQQKIQEAKQQQRTTSSSSSSSSYQSQQYDQTHMKSLQDELQRNLTQQLQDTLHQKYGRQGQLGSVSYSITSTNPGFDYNQKINDFTRQLQADFQRQLSDGLSASRFTQQSSYASSNHQPVVYNSNPHSYGGSSRQVGYSSGYSSSFGNQHSSHSDFDPDCQHDDPTTSATDPKNVEQTNIQTIVKPTYDSKSFLEQEQKQAVEPPTALAGQINQHIAQSQDNINLRHETIPAQSSIFTQKQVDSTEQLTQQTVEDHQTPKLSRESSTRRAQISYSTNQQTQTSSSYNKHSSDQQQTQDFGQQVEDSGQQVEDLGQQVEDLSQQLEELGQQMEDLGQQTMVDYGDLTQQTEDGFDQMEFSGQMQTGQKHLDDNVSDLTQQTEDGFGKLEFSGQKPKQIAGLTQQTEDAFDSFEQTNQKSQGFTQQTVNGFESFNGQKPTSQEMPDGHTRIVQQANQRSYLQSSSYSSSSHLHPTSLVDQAEDDSSVNETTPKPGFWKRVGSSIESSYHTAKDKAKSILSG